MLKDLGRGGIRLQRPQPNGAARPGFRPSIARVPPTPPTSRPSPSSTPISSPAPVRSRPVSILSRDEALDSDEDDDEDEETSLVEKPSTLSNGSVAETDIQENIEEVEDEIIRVPLDSIAQPIEEKWVGDHRDQLETSNKNAPPKVVSGEKTVQAMEDSQEKANEPELDGEKTAESKNVAKAKAKPKKQPVPSAKTKSRPDKRKDSESANAQEAEEQKSKKKREKAKALQEEEEEKTVVKKKRTPRKKKDSEAPKLKRRKKMEDSEEEENSEDFVSDYEDDIRPKAKRKTPQRKPKKKAVDNDDHEEEEKTEKTKKPTRQEKPMAERTLKSIIKDHFHGQASASSLRERTRKQVSTEAAKVEELDDEAVAKVEKVPLRAPPTREDLVAAPQVKIVDGKVVLSQESITIHADVADTSTYTRVDEIHRRVTGATYSKRIKAQKWTEAETDVFFRAITMYGTDFTFVSQLLPRRTRKEVRNKFKREQNANPAKMDAAMLSKTPMDFDEFEAALERVKTESKQKKKPDSDVEDLNKKEEEEDDDDDCVASEVVSRVRRPIEVNSDEEDLVPKTELGAQPQPPGEDGESDEGAEIAPEELEADLSWAGEEGGTEFDSF